MTTEKFSNARFRESLDGVFGGKTVEETLVPFATSHQDKDGEGLSLVVSRSGNLADAVAASANNPFIWSDTEVRSGQGIDPGADRVAATPIEDACRTFRPTRIIAVNVTGQAVFFSRQMDCGLIEVVVPVADVTADAMKGEGLEFAKVYAAGHDAALAALR